MKLLASFFYFIGICTAFQNQCKDPEVTRYCRCYIENEKVTLSCKEIPDLETYISMISKFDRKSIESMGLNGPTGIDEITYPMFKGMNLKSLSLSNMKLQKFNKHALLSSAEEMKYLTLINNSLNEIPTVMISMIEHFKGSIFIYKNNIRVLKAKSFYRVSARSINLAQNKIEKIEDGAFRNCRRITHINLKRNLLTQISKGMLPEDSKETFIVLLLQHNKLTSIPKGMFDEFPKFGNLQLNYNPIKQLSIDFALPILKAEGTVNCFNCNLTCDRQLCDYVSKVKELKGDLYASCDDKGKSFRFFKDNWLPFCH